MADEESEIRRMAEIADAINAILQSDTAQSETLAPGADNKNTQNALNENAADENAADENAADDNGQIDVAAFGLDTDSDGEHNVTQAMAENDAPDAEAATDAAAPESIEDLDAAIAAEFGAENAMADDSPDKPDDPFGPPPTLDLPAAAPTNDEIGREVRADSQMSHLSLRMQDTLHELRSKSGEEYGNASELLADMESARSAIAAQIREQIDRFAEDTRARKQRILEELDQLESQSLMARDEMEMMLVNFENSLTDLHGRYFANAEDERARLERYREFLQFLLAERGL